MNIPDDQARRARGLPVIMISVGLIALASAMSPEPDGHALDRLRAVHEHGFAYLHESSFVESSTVDSRGGWAARRSGLSPHHGCPADNAKRSARCKDAMVIPVVDLNAVPRVLRISLLWSLSRC
jgi:hypothetical protein